jgi:hypothetical protein
MITIVFPPTEMDTLVLCREREREIARKVMIRIALSPKVVRTTSDMVVNKKLVRLFLAIIFQWIRPKQVRHESVGGWLPEPIDPVEIIQCIQFRRQTSMDAKELLVHHCSQRQRAKGLRASIIHSLRVLVFACSQNRIVIMW